MPFAVYTFWVSLAVMAILIANKHFELRRGTTLIAPQLRARSDSLLATAALRHITALWQTIRVMLDALFKLLRRFFHHLFILVVHVMHRELTLILEKLKGRGIRKQHSSTTNQASFYLHHMNEYKQDLRKNSENGTDN